MELKLSRLPELARGIAIAEVISRTFFHHRLACDVLKGAFHGCTAAAACAFLICVPLTALASLRVLIASSTNPDA